MMKKFVTYTVRIMLAAGKYKSRDFSKELYLLTFQILMSVNAAICGTIIFLAVRLKYIDSLHARNELVPIGVFITFALPILVILFFRKKINIQFINEQVDKLDPVKLKKEVIKGMMIVMFSSCSILIALSILSILIKLNII